MPIRVSCRYALKGFFQQVFNRLPGPILQSAPELRAHRGRPLSSLSRTGLGNSKCDFGPPIVKLGPSATLDITSIVASNSFFELNNCGSSLAAGAQCNINVFFSPHAVGTITGTVTITDNAPDSPQTVALTGAGTMVGLSPSTLNFYTQAVGTTSAAQTVTMTNHGHRTLSLGFGLRGSNPGDFAQTYTCGNSLAAGASCTVSVTFTPQAKGSRTATLDVVDNGGGSPQTVGLKGYGI